MDQEFGQSFQEFDESLWENYDFSDGSVWNTGENIFIQEDMDIGIPVYTQDEINMVTDFGPGKTTQLPLPSPTLGLDVKKLIIAFDNHAVLYETLDKQLIVLPHIKSIRGKSQDEWQQLYDFIIGTLAANNVKATRENIMKMGIGSTYHRNVILRKT